MKKFSILVFILSIPFLISSCIDTEMTITLKLKKDGSGEIIHKTLMGKEFYNNYQKTAKSSGFGDPYDIENPNVKDAINMMAEGLGDDVELKSYENIEEGNKIGTLTSFTFEDISELKTLYSTGYEIMRSREHDLEFEYSKDAEFTLVINNDDYKDFSSTRLSEMSVTDETQEDYEEMIGSMKNFKLDVFIEVEGEVVSSEIGTFEGNKIKIVEIDVAKEKGISYAAEKMQLLKSYLGPNQEYEMYKFVSTPKDQVIIKFK